MPPPQEALPPNDPQILINRFLGDEFILRGLISSGERKRIALTGLRDSLHKQTEQQREGLLQTALSGLGKDDNFWTVDRRDGALEILREVILHINFNFETKPENSNKLLHHYLTTLSSQTKDVDAYGTVYSLLEAGKIIAKYLPPTHESKDKVFEKWERIAGFFKDKNKEEFEYVLAAGEQVKKMIPSPPGEVQEEKLGDRDTPDFEPSQQELHDLYMRETNKQGTFKIALWENTPEFRAECKEHVIDLARFWNLSDPERVSQALDTIQSSDSPIAKSALVKSLNNSIKLLPDEMTEEQKKYLADEIVHAAQAASNEIRSSVGSFDTIISRFKQVLEKIKLENPRKTKPLLSPIEKFFCDNGYDITGYSPENIEALVNDEAALSLVREYYENKQHEKINAATLLETTFNLAEQDPRFSLISRTKKDMYSGDLTGDCTAYHLNIGTNAWTLPIWRTNPGFNEFQIIDEGVFTAKMGIILSVVDGKPGLVIDSFEVGSGIRDEERAKTTIRDGLAYLHKWAQSIGLGEVLINTISNSTGAMDTLNGVSEKSTVTKVVALGGLSGVTELRKKLTGKEERNEEIYLQSVPVDDVNAEDPIAEAKKIAEEKLVEFEREIVRETINRLSETERRDFEGNIREKNWPAVFEKMISTRYKNLDRVMGGKWQDYQIYMDEITLDSAGNAREQTDNIFYNEIDSKASEASSEFGYENLPLKIKRVYDRAFNEGKNVENILKLLKEMGFHGMSPENALERLFAEVKVKKVDQLTLNPGLPKLVI